MFQMIEGYPVADVEIRAGVVEADEGEILYSNLLSPGEWARPFGEWSLQVSGVDDMGDPQAPTSWEVALETSIDGVIYATVLTHKGGVDANGSIVSLAGLNAVAWRLKLVELTVGSAESIYVSMIGRN
ncbi:MAG: hypothetical protein ACREN0_08630 [Thermodesulfobacteriota bacterium]